MQYSGMMMSALLLLSAPLAARLPAQAAPQAAIVPEHNGLSDSTILIVRHAEKPPEGSGLTPAGEARANRYAQYFRRFAFAGTPLHVDTLVAAADTANSDRPRLTLAPLARSAAMPVEQPASSDDVDGLAQWLRAGRSNRTVLVAWHHSEIGRLISALGADPDRFLFVGRWPPSVYDWVVVLRFDAKGQFEPDASGLVKETGSLA